VLFGEERLVASLNSGKDFTPDKLIENVKSDIDRFVGDAPQFDDLTMLALTIK
jgi:sigma-B regulation protein RsbU (phosphoserine phosphatase)